MSDTKKMDLFVGVKAEQSLRDAVRDVVEQSGEEVTDLELTPVGRKDWIAGKRVGSDLAYADAARVCKEVLSQLIALDSRQRIRLENVRFYVIAPPVPVFKDPPSDADGSVSVPPQPEPEPDPEPVSTPEDTGLGGPTTCPVCNRSVHSYNLQHDTKGKVVGCFICGGEPGR